MKSTKENLTHRKWYVIDDNLHTIIQYNEADINSCVGYCCEQWGTWEIDNSGRWEVEEAAKEHLAKLGKEWEPYWEEPKEEVVAKMREFETGATRNLS